MGVDINILERLYFAQDKSVPFSTALYEKEHKNKINQLQKTVVDLQKKILENPYNHKLIELQEHTFNLLSKAINDFVPELQIYPIILKDYEQFMSSVGCILLDKNDSIELSDPDQIVEILQMSYLDYLIYAGKKDKSGRIFNQLANLLSLTLKENVYSKDLYKTKDSLGKTLLVVNDKYYFNENDFDDFKDIVGYCNLPSYSNKFQNKDILEEIRRINYLKMGHEEEISFEEKVTTLSCLTHMPEKDIWEMTFRRFNMKFSKSNEILHYTINKLVEGMGQFKFKRPIQNFLTKPKADIGLVDLDNFTDKIGGSHVGVTIKEENK